MLAAAVFSGALLLSGVVLYAIMLLAVGSAVRQRSQPLTVSEAARRLAVPAVDWCARRRVVRRLSSCIPRRHSRRRGATTAGFSVRAGTPGHTVRQAISIGRVVLRRVRCRWRDAAHRRPRRRAHVVRPRRWRTTWWLLLAPDARRDHERGAAVSPGAARQGPHRGVADAVVRGARRADASPSWAIPRRPFVRRSSSADARARPLSRSSRSRSSPAPAKQTVLYPTTPAREALRTISGVQDRRLRVRRQPRLSCRPRGAGPDPGRGEPNVDDELQRRAERGYHAIKGNDPDRRGVGARSSLRRTAAIVGVDPETLAKAFPHMHCRVLTGSVNRRHTTEVHDDTVILRLGPRTHSPRRPSSRDMFEMRGATAIGASSGRGWCSVLFFEWQGAPRGRCDSAARGPMTWMRCDELCQMSSSRSCANLRLAPEVG